MDVQVTTKALRQLVNNYAFDRIKGIEHLAEPHEVAACHLKIYGYALADASEVLFGRVVSAEVYIETNRLLAELDPGRTFP